MRTADEICKKLSTYTSTVKKQAAFVRREARKTAGGPTPDRLTPLQDKVVGIIGDAPIVGISGGLDTASCQAADPMDQSIEDCLFETSIPSTSCTVSVADDINLSQQTIPTSSPPSESTEETLVEIERERLCVEKERLAIEKERLATEKERLEIERKSLFIKEQKYQLYMTKLNLNLQQMGISVNNIPHLYNKSFSGNVYFTYIICETNRNAIKGTECTRMELCRNDTAKWH